MATIKQVAAAAGVRPATVSYVLNGTGSVSASTRARVLAATLFPELAYALFLDLVYLKGIVDMSLGRTADWKHVVQTPTGAKVGADA